MTTINVTTATREQLASWYLEEVGYDPIQDTPSMTTNELRILCNEMVSELGIYHDDTR